MAWAADLLTCCQELPFGFASIHEPLGRYGDVEKPSLYLKWVSSQTLPCFPRRSARGDSGGIENPVVAGAEEAVVLGFPAYLAPEMGASAGEGDKVLCPSFTCLPGNIDGFAGRTFIEDRLADLDGVYLSHELPGELFGPGRV